MADETPEEKAQRIQFVKNLEAKTIAAENKLAAVAKKAQDDAEAAAAAAKAKKK